MSEVNELVEQELNHRGIPFEYSSEDDLYVIHSGGMNYQVTLDNLARSYIQNPGQNLIVEFVDNLQIVFKGNALNGWDDVRDRIYPYIIQNVIEREDAIFNVISKETAHGYVVTGDDGVLMWVTKAMFEKWGIKEAVMQEAAYKNMAKIIQKAEIEIIGEGENIAGCVTLEKDALKASVILSPAFKDLVKEKIGWPVFAVIPCRDFLLFCYEKKQHVIQRLGAIVGREYANSPYALTLEVFHVSDEGVKVVGRFDQKPNN